MRRIINSTYITLDGVIERPDELIYRDCPTAIFDLVDTRVLQNGVVVLRYRHAHRDVSAS